MGKSSKPLFIMVTDAALYHSPEVQALKDKGHRVSICIDDRDYDVIIGQKCWRIIPWMGKLATQLTLMLAGVRAVKYPKPPKES